MKPPIKIPPMAMHPATVWRFWTKVKKAGQADCWEWRGTISSNGYGAFKLGRSSVTSSRMAYALSTNDDPLDLMVLHTCDNRKCCNPGHLYKGDVRQNSKDMVDRGRHVANPVFGSRNHKAKLNENDILEIRRRIAAGETNVSIAADFGVSHGMISKIRHGQFWKKVQGEAA